MLFSLTYFRIEVFRHLRNPYTLAFTIAMPVTLYAMFGIGTDYATMSVGNANVSMYVMASMAAFGAATAMASLCSIAASEVGQGWGRQLGLTPLSITGYALVKLVTALCFASLSTAAVFAVGLSTGAAADDLWRPLAVAGLIVLGSLMFGLFGLGVGLVFNSDTGTALASIAVTFFGFFGNVFMPLNGVMLEIAHFTPMYGFVALVRWPLTDGTLVAGGADPLWMVLLNVVGWALIFALITRFGVLRSRQRR